MHSDSHSSAPTTTSLLTLQQTEQFERDGFLLVKGILDANTRQSIIASLSDMAARRDEFPPSAFVLEPDAADVRTPLDEVRKFQSLQILSADIRRFFECDDSRPRQMVSQLMGADDLRIQFLSCFAKPARIGGETPWHQDQGLWPLWMPTATSCWIALDAATLENGCVQFARASQNDGMERHEMIEGKIHESVPVERTKDYEIVPVEMEPGDGVFFGGRVWHYSEPNRSAKRRLGMPVVYVSEAELQSAFACSQWIAGRQHLDKAVVVNEEVQRQYQISNCDSTRLNFVTTPLVSDTSPYHIYETSLHSPHADAGAVLPVAVRVILRSGPTQRTDAQTQASPKRQRQKEQRPK